MTSGDEWDAGKMLELYLHDYMVKKNMHKTAETFAKEANVCNNPVVIDSPDGFLSEWWLIFYDIYASRQLKHGEAKGEASVKATQMTESELQNLRPIVPQLEMNHPRVGQFPIGTDFDKMLEQPEASLLAAKIYEEEHLKRLAGDFDPNLRLLDIDKLALSTSAAKNTSRPQQQIPKQTQQLIVRDNRHGMTLGRIDPTDPTLYGVPKAIVPRTRLRDAGMDKGVNPIPLKGRPLTGVDQIPPGLGHRVLNSLLPAPNQQQQFPMLTAQHQEELLAQVLAQTPEKPISYFPGSTSDLDTRNLMLTRSDLNGKDGQMMVQKRQTAEQQQQQQDQLQQQQSQENNRKRKTLSYPQAGDNTLDGRDAEEDKPFDENVESFLSHDDDNADITSNPFSTLQRRSTACSKNEHKGFSFEEVGYLNSSKSKVLCCHFSSDGKLLASAGHDKKVLIWNMNSFESVNTSEGHSHLITDIRFTPSSTVFATSSFDKTVQIWDAARPSKSLFKLLGHAEQVMSLDFHPRKVDLLCSCDGNDEIRLWNVNQCACIRVSKGATRQVRFQPRAGKLLAAAAGNGISIIDVETDSLHFNLKGHVEEIRSICWDTSGKYIASVSEDSARVWSAVGGKCIHELHSNGNKFQSCAFHPGYSHFLVIGGYQSLELWNPTDGNKTMTVPAHNGLIAALADSPQTETVASASHDKSVKLWK